MREDWVDIEIEVVFDTLENGKDINQGWSPQCKKHPSPSEDIWGVLKTTAIQKNVFWDHENKELPKDKQVREYLEVNEGDILLTCAGPRNRCGIACTVKKTRKKLLLSGKMYRFRVNEKLMTTKFMILFLQTQEAWLGIDKMKTGGSESGLNLTHSRFRKLPIYIAPLPIQHAIVSKIETLFSDLDNGITDLKKAQDQLKIYRQAVLQKAFEGEYLTKKVVEFADVKTGSTPKRGNLRYWEKGTVPWITSGALNNSFVTSADELITQTALEETNCKIIPKGSLLVAMYGEGKTRGKCSELNIDAATNQAIATITLFDEYLDSKNFVKWFFIKNYEEIRLLSSGGVQPNLNLSIVKNTVLPFPSPTIQKQIIKEIESRLSVCDKVEQSISEALSTSEALRQSILKKAFEDKLLSTAEIERCKQEADYEPAGVLLERIRMEKTK